MRNSDFKNLDKMFLNRWSPRSYKGESINDDDLLTIFEAARWAPSCFNEQPWLFVYSKKKEDLKKFQEILNEGNQLWAKNAPILLAIFSRRTFNKNGKENRWADFDAGAAWMSLSLQALKLGIYCHSMAGYDPQKAYSVCKVDPKKYNSVCMTAIGRIDSPDKLEGPLREREIPSERNKLQSFVFEGSLSN